MAVCFVLAMAFLESTLSFNIGFFNMNIFYLQTRFASLYIICLGFIVHSLFSYVFVYYQEQI